MKDKLSEEQTKAILKAFDEAIEQGPWEESNFLRVIGKNLREIREQFLNQLDLAGIKNQKDEQASVSRQKLRSGQKEVFVVLYSSAGSNLQAWERILANLPGQMISRPIYDDEINAQEIIRSKENRINEAYAVVYVDPDDVLPMAPDKVLVDKLGKPLLTLKDKALKIENIHRFVHLLTTYKFTSGRLVKITEGKEV